MNTFLLLAGRSTRFWPLADKTLFPICGKTLLEHQIERLKKGGCEHIILVGGAHNMEDAKNMFPDLPTVEQEDLTRGMRGALESILAQYGSDPLMVVSGNDVIEPRAYAELLATKRDGAILARKVDRYFPGGYLTTDGTRATGIVEKPGEGNEPSDLVNIVAHVHRDPAALLSALQEIDEASDDGYEQALARLFSQKHYLAVAYNGHWSAVKYPWHILDLAQMLLGEIDGRSIDPTANIHPSAEIIGNVVIGAGVNILHNAVIRGPAFIGQRCTIGNNALVRHSCIGDDCVVGFGTEVKESVFAGRVQTHMNYVGDSVVGHNVSFGGGAITGNFRLDEQEISSVIRGQKIPTGRTKLGCIVGDHSRIGVHVSTNPGVKIGANTFVCTPVFVSKDLDDGTFAYMKDGILEIRENRTQKLST